MCGHVRAGGSGPARAAAVAQRYSVRLLPAALRGAVQEAPAEAGGGLAFRQAACGSGLGQIQVGRAP